MTMRNDTQDAAFPDRSRRPLVIGAADVSGRLIRDDSARGCPARLLSTDTVSEPDHGEPCRSRNCPPRPRQTSITPHPRRTAIIEPIPRMLYNH
jgi:hypothetical protein